MHSLKSYRHYPRITLIWILKILLILQCVRAILIFREIYSIIQALVLFILRQDLFTVISAIDNRMNLYLVIMAQGDNL